LVDAVVRAHDHDEPAQLDERIGMILDPQIHLALVPRCLNLLATLLASRPPEVLSAGFGRAG